MDESLKMDNIEKQSTIYSVNDENLPDSASDTASDNASEEYRKLHFAVHGNDIVAIF